MKLKTWIVILAGWTGLLLWLTGPCSDPRFHVVDGPEQYEALALLEECMLQPWSKRWGDHALEIVTFVLTSVWKRDETGIYRIYERMPPVPGFLLLIAILMTVLAGAIQGAVEAYSWMARRGGNAPPPSPTPGPGNQAGGQQ